MGKQSPFSVSYIKGRYQRVLVKIWHDEKVLELSDSGKLLFIYLLTSPHSNAIGAYVVKKGYVAEDLGWSVQRTAKTIDVLAERELIQYDKTVGVLSVCNYLYYNPVENPNQLISAVRLFRALPRSPILKHLAKSLETLSEGFAKSSGNDSVRVTNLLGKPVSVAVTVPVTVTVTGTGAGVPLTREELQTHLKAPLFPVANCFISTGYIITAANVGAFRKWAVELATDYPDRDLIANAKKWRDYNSGRKPVVNHKSSFRNWVSKDYADKSRARHRTPEDVQKARASHG